MPIPDDFLNAPRPDDVRSFPLPRRVPYTPSPVDWRNEVLYFLLVDRFSDGGEDGRKLLDRGNIARARGANWQWQKWAKSGKERWQGGTIRGTQSKLPYLKELGVTAIWLSPVFKQRVHLNTYHGYGVQDFLEVDPRFGTRDDLVALVAAAHKAGIRVILDIIFNHSGANWIYADGTPDGPHTPRYTEGRYAFGQWLDGSGAAAPIGGADDGVWPRELQLPDAYTRAGKANLAEGTDIAVDTAEHKRGDFEDLRNFELQTPGVLTYLARCYKYWIALTDCDGFRIDTLKHVSFSEGRNFCGTIKEFAANIGKENFFLVGEVAGGDHNEKRYLEALERNLDAVLDIGSMRPTLVRVGRGFGGPGEYFKAFEEADVLGSHRVLGKRHVSVLDDHDMIFREGARVRFAADAPVAHQPAVPVAVQLFTLGIPCIYYGTEQALAPPEKSEWQWIDEMGGSDAFVREAMFGPEHPRASGSVNLTARDTALVGFGPFGTAGQHVFDTTHPAYTRIAAIAKTRAAFPVLRQGRQYQRPTSIVGAPFALPPGGELLAWSRIIDDEEALCVVNTNGAAARGARVLVDASLNPAGSSMTVVLHTGKAAAAGTKLQVSEEGGIHFVDVRDVGPAEVLVLTNQP
jgi:glycosidase